MKSIHIFMTPPADSTLFMIDTVELQWLGQVYDYEN